ncbi:hypothetical protein V492_01149 [Pseudogymnoascus sp. VKM F-4246]|nr:hypothetical protein V492_01149 [Pseudogymnoascus sp. VKM F-4246]
MAVAALRRPPVIRPAVSDPITILTQAIANGQGQQLIDLITAQIEAKKSTNQPESTGYDFDLSGGQAEVMYVTFRMGPRRELVFKIGPETKINDAIHCCVDTWTTEWGRFWPWELFFYLPCNSRIDYYATMTAAQLGVENHDLIDVFTESYGG